VVHIQAEGVRTVDIKTAVTDAVGKVGPAVVTVINHLASRGFNPFSGQLESAPKASGTGGKDEEYNGYSWQADGKMTLQEKN
jgi:hypothetical protein